MTTNITLLHVYESSHEYRIIDARMTTQKFITCGMCIAYIRQFSLFQLPIHHRILYPMYYFTGTL